MDIVRSAAKNVKIKEFFFSANNANIDVSAAIRDIMLLFNVNAAGVWPEGACLTELNTDKVLVLSSVRCEEDQVCVKVVISFCTSAVEIESLTETECRFMSQERAKSEDGEDVTGLIRRLVRLT
ncbi:MAG: miaB 2, partial [Sporomusa sp.]|nr:miaB 2 [Sporomusa sp.]